MIDPKHNFAEFAKLNGWDLQPWQLRMAEALLDKSIVYQPARRCGWLTVRKWVVEYRKALEK